MGHVSSKRLAFLASLDNPVQTVCSKSTRRHIDSFISREYANIISAISYNLSVTSGGVSAFDRLNDAILNIYSDKKLSFSNQSECDLYMEKELNYRRFIISVRVTNYKSE